MRKFIHILYIIYDKNIEEKVFFLFLGWQCFSHVMIICREND